MSNIPAFFNRKYAAAASKQGKKFTKTVFITPLKENKEYPITSFSKTGEHKFRLVPAVGELDNGNVEVVKVIPVYKTQEDGTRIDGRIVAGEWFFKYLNPFLMEHYKERFASKANKNGDIKFRTKSIALFWVMQSQLTEDGTEVTRKLHLATLPCAAYASAPKQAGDLFLEGGKFANDFDAEKGRELIANVSRKDPNDPLTKTVDVVVAKRLPTQKEVDTFVNAGLPAPEGIDNVVHLGKIMGLMPECFLEVRPSLKDMLRISDSTEIINCIKATLPQDVADAFLAAHQKDLTSNDQ